MHTIKALDRDAVLRATLETRGIVYPRRAWVHSMPGVERLGVEHAPGHGAPRRASTQPLTIWIINRKVITIRLTAEEAVGRLESVTTGEWMYLFKPLLAGTVLYVKLIVRNDCIVVSFHEDEGDDHEEEDA